MVFFLLLGFCALVGVSAAILIGGETTFLKYAYATIMIGFTVFFVVETVKSLVRQCRGTLRPIGSHEDLAELRRICSLTETQAKQEGCTVVYDAERDGYPPCVYPGESLNIETGKREIDTPRLKIGR